MGGFFNLTLCAAKVEVAEMQLLRSWASAVAITGC